MTRLEVLSSLLLVLLAPVDSDWIPGYMDREGVLRTYPVSNNLQEVQELKGVQEDSPKKILLRIKLPKTEQSPEVIRHSSSRHPKLNQQKTF